MAGATRSLLLRALISATVGVAMIGTTFQSAFRGMRGAFVYDQLPMNSFKVIIAIIDHLEDYRKEKGRYPESLADIKGPLSEYLESDTSGRVLDSWKHPIEYWSDGQSYTLRSLGLDGKPGGQGLDWDLDAREIVQQDKSYKFPRRNFLPTFWQYTFNLDTKGVKISCALAGVFAAIACFVTLSNQRIRLAGMLGRLFVTLLMCFFITSIITALHTPNHH